MPQLRRFRFQTIESPVEVTFGRVKHCKHRLNVSLQSPLLWGRREEKAFESRSSTLQRKHAADDMAGVVDVVRRLKRPLVVGCDFSIQIEHLAALPEERTLFAIAA